MGETWLVELGELAKIRFFLGKVFHQCFLRKLFFFSFKYLVIKYFFLINENHFVKRDFTPICFIYN